MSTEAPARTIDDARVIVADILKSASMGDADEVASCRKALRFLSDDAALEDELNAERLAASLQNVEQLLAADADEAMAGRALAGSLEEKLDVVPMIEGDFDLGRGLGVPGAHRIEGEVGEDHAPAERIVGAIALDHRDGMLGPQLLHQQAEIETRRSSSDANDPHGSLPSVLLFEI